MTTYSAKLKHILPTFFAVTIGTVVGVGLLRWTLTIQFPVIDIKEEVWTLWIPLAFPWVPITLWLRPKFRILTFKKDNDNGRFFFQFLSWCVLTPMLFVSQSYLTTASGKLQTLTDIQEIDSIEKCRYYSLANFDVARSLGGGYTDFRASGKYNQYLNFDVYFVHPIASDTLEFLTEMPKHWYGIKYKEQISNKISQEEKERKYKAFYEECIQKISRYDYHDLDHFERTPTSSDKENFLKAIEARIQQPAGEDFVVLEPVMEPYESRNGNKFAWIFGSFGIGLGVLLFALIWPGFSQSEYRRQVKGVKPKQDDLVDMLRFLIPKGEHFATSIILDLNILVFLIMLFSGIHLLAPNGMELLEWGGNRRMETTGGEWWRLFTNMFVHGGIMHLFMNIFGLVLAGIFVEAMLGRKNYFIIYVISGICGSLASIWWYENTVSVGASGAIFGLYGAILGLLLTNAFSKESRKVMFSLIGIFVGINLLWGLTGGIDNAAHIGGLLSGAIMGLVLYKLDERRVRAA